MADKSYTKKEAPKWTTVFDPPAPKTSKPPIGAFITPKSIFKPKPVTITKASSAEILEHKLMTSIDPDDLPKTAHVVAPKTNNTDIADDDSISMSDEEQLPEQPIEVSKDDEPMTNFISKMSEYIESKSPSTYSDSKKSKNDSLVDMTTDGLSYEDVKKYVYVQKNGANGLKQCNICTKYFPEMVTTDQFDGGTTCWHCLFFLNSDDISRIEDIYQISLTSYVEFCGPAHNPENCVRADSCMLCLSNNNVPTQVKWEDPNKIDQFIDNIKNDIIDKRLDGEIDFGISI